MRKLIILGIALIPLGGYCQNEVDALRYSRLEFGGSSRYNAMAGAFGAIGADLSVGSVNPAGLARFNRSEFSFTPSFTDYNTDASYNGTTDFGGDLRLNMSNIGFVSTTRIPKTDNYNKWRSVQFAVAYNKLAIFNQSARISGDNTNSLLAVFAQQANGIATKDLRDFLPFSSYIAYDTYTLDSVPGVLGQYTHPMQYGDVMQERTLTRKGGLNETAISLSANYDNKLYIGGTIGIPGVRFTEDYSHFESKLFDTSATDITNFTYSYSQTTRGSGINAKIGIIILPTDFIRIGLAAHTKTRLALNDRWSTSMNSNFDNGDSYNQSSPDQGNFSYVITTPGRFILSMAGIIAKKGVISADVEYVDYSQAKMKSNSRFGGNYDFHAENIEIQRQFGSAINLRVGGEFRLNKFFFRGGYALSGNPYDESDQEFVVNDPVKSSYTFGVGFRNKSFFLDMGYMLTLWSEDYYLYDPVLVNEAALKNNLSNLSFTVGFRY